MYEIPPSVDHYLRVSSRSMIHFPAVSVDATLASSLEQNDISSSSSKKLLMREIGGSNLDVTNGNYLVCSSKRKRSNENYEEDQLPELKHRRTKYVDSLDGVDDTKQDIVNRDAANYAITLANKEISRGDLFQGSSNRDEELAPKNLTRRLPELRPKTADKEAKYNSLETQVPCHHYSNGRTAVRKNPWGPQSYSELISGAIKASPEHRASLQKIYDWIVHNVTYFKDKADYPSTKGWKNAIRHTLSIRKRFTRIINERSPHASLWTFSNHAYRTMTKY